MEIKYYKEYSSFLNRDMEYKVFGDKGKIVIVFPTQDGRFFDYENRGMVDILKPEIEAGKLQLVCIDSIDKETWSNKEGNPRARMELHEKWYNYVMVELIPTVVKRNPQKSGLMATGCSMGGFHSANFFFRRPDIFDSVIALSGLYDGTLFIGDYHDDLVYANAPIEYIGGMPMSHPYLELYKKCHIYLCTGQGEWEDDMRISLDKMRTVLQDHKIDAYVDFWGFDVNHDWPWWEKQLRYFIDMYFNDIKK